MLFSTRGAVARVTDVKARYAGPPFNGTVADLLRDCAESAPDLVLMVWEDRKITTSETFAAARKFAGMLSARDIGPGKTVVTMLDAGPNYIAMFLAVTLTGATWAPLSPDAKGPSLAHALSVAEPSLIVAAPQTLKNLHDAGHLEAGHVLEIEGWAWFADAETSDFGAHAPSSPDTVRAVLFTSGTTGAPKGVIVTERMLMASAAGCAFASKCEANDVFLMWEPMHHIGGPQLLIMALVHGARLVLVRKFSASRFWPAVRNQGVSKLHYLGGILEILLKSAEGPNDKDHPVKLAFGGGARPETRRDFRKRFAIPIREVYGMTEASSFTTVDDQETENSIGRVLPWMEAELIADDGKPMADYAIGEIIVRPRYTGLVTPGYLGNPEATAKLLKSGWLHTGDLARRDTDGNFHFLGRKTDSLRRRGENISAWEVETALSAHPEIAETAIVGVPSEIGEADILCFVLMREGYVFDAEAISAWCRSNLPRHHVPRYWKTVSGFARTPSQRIKKERLDTGLVDAIDLGDEQPTPERGLGLANNCRNETDGK